MTASQPPQPPEGAQPLPGAQQPLGEDGQPPALGGPAPGHQHGPPPHRPPPHGDPPYGRPPDRQPPGYGPPAGQPGSGPPPYGQHPYGQRAYGPPQYGPPPAPQPYGPPQPYGWPQPYGPPPYGQQPYVSQPRTPPPGQPYGQAPYGQAPYGSAPYGSAPYGPAPYGSAPYGPAPYGAGPYGSPGYPYGRPVGGAEFSVDLRRVTREGYAVAGGTSLYLLLGLLPWWRFGDETFGVTLRGVDDGMVVSALMLFLLATGWALLPGFVRTSPTFPRSSVTAALSALGLVLTLFAWLDTLRYAFSSWALLALLTAVAITTVSGLALRREMRQRPSRPGAPPPAGHWPGAGAPGQGHSSAPQPRGQVHPPAPGPFPPPAYPGQPGPAAGGHGYAPTPPPWRAAPPAPEDQGHRTGDASGPGGSTASGAGPDVTDSDRPRTDT